MHHLRELKQEITLKGFTNKNEVEAYTCNIPRRAMLNDTVSHMAISRLKMKNQ